MSTSEQPCRQFSLDEIKSATRDFDDELIIGKGGFGSVYIGSINDDAKIVAIKRLSIESTQGDTEFLREIETLSKLQHDNLVRLEGYCNESTEKILVYEYMPNGTLVDHLYKIKGSTSVTGDNQPSRLTWEQRLSICIGAAKGLDFLHRGALPVVIHRDIKGSNILLDGNFRAKIADFGLAKLVKPTNDPNITCVSTTIFKGTFGYMDPEYFYTQRLTPKTDVYAFGVVLLVVLSGRSAVDNKVVEDQRSLAEWAKKCIEKNKVDLIIDPYLAGKISIRSLKQFLKVSQRCLLRKSDQRPTMEEVVAGLELALKKQPPSVLITRQPNEGSSLRQMIMGKLQQISKKKQRDKEKCLPSTLVAGCLCRQFSLEEIMTATRNFSTHIGQGGFGSVCLGRINNGAEIVAIKRFHSNWYVMEELKILSNLQNDHVVHLKGYCLESSERILVYEYLANGSLENHLNKTIYNEQAYLTWEQRLKICVGAAQGLDFLHRVTEPRIIHLNVKCSKIMLDDNFVPKITGFGHSKLSNYEDDEISTRVCGTMGYIAPEYLVTKKIDVYGFGVVLFVVLSGRRPHDTLYGDGKNDKMPFYPWAVQCIRDNKIDELIDHNLRGQFKSESLEKYLEVAQKCLHMDPGKRYTMEEVVAGLELALEKQLSSTSTQWVESHELANLLCLLPNENVKIQKQLSSTSTQWVESHELANLLCLLPNENVKIQKQLSSTSTQWVESHELANLLCLLPNENVKIQKQLSSTSTQWVESHELANLLCLLPNENVKIQKQLSSTSTQWVESHELANLLCLLPNENVKIQDDWAECSLDDYADSEDDGEYSSELYKEFMEEYSDM